MIEKRNDWQERLSPRVNAIAPSGIRKFFDIAAQMEDVISLGVGEPDFVTPWSIRESCVYGLEQGYTSYTANRGLPELREEIACHYADEYGCSYDADTDILVTVGVSEALDLVMRAILAPGDEVLIPEPCYVSYQACTILAGGKPVAVPAKIENEFRITPDELEEHVTPKTKALLIGYPNNPTGAIMTRKDLLAIANFAEKHDLIVISDEIYGDLTYGGEKHVCFSSLPGTHDPPQRLLEGVCHDGLAHRLCARQQGLHQRHDEDPPVHDALRADHSPDCGHRGAAPRREVHEEDGR